MAASERDKLIYLSEIKGISPNEERVGSRLRECRKYYFYFSFGTSIENLAHREVVWVIISQFPSAACC
jgi:hypothetical protein